MKHQKNVNAITTKGLEKYLNNIFSIFNGAKYFPSRMLHNYLAFIRAKKYIKYFIGTTRIDSWVSNEMSDESIENITNSHNKFAQTFVDHLLLPDIKFNGHF